MCLDISADGTTLASGANDGSVKIWNLSKPREDEGQDVVASFQLVAGRKIRDLNSLMFSADGNILFGVAEHATTAKNIFSGQLYPDLRAQRLRRATNSLLSMPRRDAIEEPTRFRQKNWETEKSGWLARSESRKNRKKRTAASVNHHRLAGKAADQTFPRQHAG